MLFEPEALLLLAQRSGLTLSRKGAALVVTSAHAIPEAWADTIRQHKPALLPFLPEATAKNGRSPVAEKMPAGQTYDLFGPVPPQPVRTRRGAKREKATAGGMADG
jgi:hypothetical protein